MPSDALNLTKPGLFVTGTDTGVGKTVVACAIAAALRRQRPGVRVGVCKPFATGCRTEREGLVSEDAEALAHFADCRLALDVINPVRFAPPLSPAAASEQTGKAVDWAELRRAIERVDEWADVVVVEGIGGVMVPLDRVDAQGKSGGRIVTVLDLAAWLGWPVLVVARAGLGTLNHTAMTVRLLDDSGCRAAGIVINNYEPDVAKSDDPSLTSNPAWLQRLTGAAVLATVPRVGQPVTPGRGRLPRAILDAVATRYWPDVLRPPAPVAPWPLSKRDKSRR